MEASLQQPEQNTWRRAAVVMLSCALAYAAADYTLNRTAFADGWTIFWPLNGITIALLITRPRSQWAPILLGVAIGTGLSERLDNSLSATIVQRLISVTEVLISACLLPPFLGLNHWLRQPHIYRRFLTALLLGPGVTGIAAALYFHHLQNQPYLVGFNNWATADALGIATTMPLCLAVFSPELRQLLNRASLPRTLLVLTIAISCAALGLSVSRYPLLFLLYPVLLLVDAQLAFAGSALVMFAVCVLAVYFATHLRGPFGLWPQDLAVSRDVALQIYLGFHVVALFPASLRILERKRIGEALRDANVQLTMLASLDGLTGIANRRALDERFAQEWSRTQRSRAPLAMLMIDIDHFKQFNDRYGHHAGDQALIMVATALASHMRRPEDLVARFGGEEFAVLLPHTELGGAAYLAEHLRQAIVALAIPHTGSPWGHVTVSIGCAAGSPAGPTFSPDRFRLLTAADQALYQAKHSGRNCVESGALIHEPAL